MERQKVVDRFVNVRSYNGNGIRAPHKPLLILYVLARFYEGKRHFPFLEIENSIKNLLIDFGPSRNSYRVEYPFWRLQKDKIWGVSSSSSLKSNSSGDVGRSVLIGSNANGFFPEPIETLLNDDPRLISELISNLLFHNFPKSIHKDILVAIGFETQCHDIVQNKRKRDHKFRENVLRAYDYRCAVCGFDVRVGHTPVALEAAHIKWHQAGGPDAENNGLALCSLHHKLFDRGAFTISENDTILISNMANGSSGFSEWLMKFHGMAIQQPQSNKYLPAPQYIEWHAKEVFQGELRDS